MNAYRGKIIIGLHLKHFFENPTFENARTVFLTCSKYDQDVPEYILKSITMRFEKDQEIERKKEATKLQKTSTKYNLNQLLLEFALTSDSLEEAYQAYRKETGTDQTNPALRKMLERFLVEELPELEDLKLTEKIDAYKEHIFSF